MLFFHRRNDFLEAVAFVISDFYKIRWKLKGIPDVNEENVLLDTCAKSMNLKGRHEILN